MPYRTSSLLLLLLGCAAPVHAQSITAGVDLLFYGDNTEFANPFRSGETVLGGLGRLFLEAPLNDRVRVRGGFFGLGRFGARRFLEHAEPFIALEVSRGPSRVIFGSLETMQTRHDVAGPDRETLHGLLPPLQRETLTFHRGQELGLQWLVASARVDHDAWIDWQRLNTPDHRERFDAGARTRVAVMPAVAIHTQWHLVHEGGQQSDRGPVRDSQGGGLGGEYGRPIGASRLTLDAHAVATRDVPDRERPSLIEAGLGVFARGALERGPWRAHLIGWRGRDLVKDEGDGNYLAARADGTRFRGVRDYAELGLTRHFRPAPGVHLFAAARLHRVESQFEYSYRIVGRVTMRAGIGK